MTTTTQSPTEAYLSHLRDTGHAQKTILNAASMCARLDAFMQGRELTKELIHEYTRKINAEDAKPGGKRGRVQEFRAFLYWTRKHGFHAISRDDILDFTPKCKPAIKTEPVVLTREQIKALYDVVKSARAESWRLQRKAEDAARAILAALFTGCRAQEAQSITLNEATQSLTFTGSKVGSERSIPLSLFKGCPEFWVGKRRWNLTLWNQWRREAGLEWLNVKDLRSNWTNYAKASGMPRELSAWYQGHTEAIAIQSYERRAPMSGVAGETVAQWFGL